MIVEDKTKEIGAKIIVLESVDSTNNYAAKAVAEGELNHGTVILAEEQTNGRGQRGNSWQSDPKKNLHFSFYVRPQNLSIDQHMSLSFITSIALVQALEKFQITAEIKWPNDVFVGEEKISGMLIETQVQQNKISGAIIGLGINVNQEYFDGLKATSCKIQHQKELDLWDLLDRFLIEFNTLWQAFPLMAYEVLQRKYYQHLFGYQSERQFVDKDGVFRGTILGVDKQGRLVVDKNGSLHSYDLKEIQFILD